MEHIDYKLTMIDYNFMIIYYPFRSSKQWKISQFYWVTSGAFQYFQIQE